MDTQQLRYFLQLCADKNYLSAANKLYITQQALRKSIKKLEMETAGPLFYREGDSLELTKVGVCVRSHARNVIGELDKMEIALERIKNDVSHMVTIASSYGIYPRIVDELLIGFEREHPDIELKILEMRDAECEDAIRNGDADLGFCIGPNDPQYFETYEYERHEVVAMVNKSNSLSKREVLELKDLEGQRIAIVNEHFKLYHNFLRCCRQHDINPNIVLRGGDVISVQNFSRFDENLAITVSFLAKDLGFETSTIVPMDVEGLDWTINMLVGRKARLSDYARQVCDFVLDFIGIAPEDAIQQ